MKIQFINDERALLLGNALIIADLHLGVERELAEKGVKIWEENTNDVIKRVKSLIKTTGAKKIIILGDLKHYFYGKSYSDINEIKKFLKAIKIETILIKGNHDGAIEQDINITVKKSLLIEDCLLIHGHSIPKKKAKIIIMGHEHPSYFFQEGVYKWIMPVWMVVEGKMRIIVVPAFSKLIGSNPINEEDHHFLSPLFSNRFFNVNEKNNIRLFLLNGVEIKGEKSGSAGQKKRKR